MTIWAQGLALLLLGAWTSKGAGSAPVLLLCKPKQGEKWTYAQEGSSIKRRLGCLVRTDGPWRPHGRAAPRTRPENSRRGGGKGASSRESDDRASAAQTSKLGARAPALVGLLPGLMCLRHQSSERKPRRTNRRFTNARAEKMAATKSTRTNSKQKESLPNLVQMQFNLARNHSQKNHGLGLT
jgi:hypothetical protein